MSQTPTAETPTVLTGGGFCGAITYQLAGPLAPATRCHCSMCRKRFGGTGSAMAVSQPSRKPPGPTLTSAGTPRGP